MLSVKDLRVIDIMVIELCFGDASKALEVAVRIVKDHPIAVHAVYTESDLTNDTSVIHIHVRKDRVDDLLGHYPYIKGSGGVMLLTAIPTSVA